MISVIIPTLNEAANLPALLTGLMLEDVPCDIIVVDGGSTDETVSLAEGFGVRVVQSDPGRGRQLAAGAEKATGEIVLFLHADTQFPEGALAAMAAALKNSPDAPGGNFRLLFDGDDGFSRWLEGFYAFLRARGFYYGDSGQFIRRRVLDSIGGVCPVALMEDHDLARRMEAWGKTLCIETPPLVTSSRRFRGRHPVAIVWGWVKIHALYYLGVDTDRLAGLYDSHRRRENPEAPQDPASLRPQSYS
ncbi:MAG: glycosyltransferase family 2 protein [Alphaproteobacteria bacterium]|jgi:rSAM/selenodomain-associated transferase 2|nr:glycosyltransferase family 2 protein [Alphaproteobacteria bacterium]